MQKDKVKTKCNACNTYEATHGTKCESCNGVLKHNINSLLDKYKKKTCECKYPLPQTKCSESGITSYCTKCGKGFEKG